MPKQEMRRNNIKTYYPIITWTVILFMVTVICSYKTAIGAEGDYLSLPMPQEFTPALQADGAPQYISGKDIEQEVKKAVRQYDIGEDGIIGLPEAIRALQTVSGQSTK